MPLPPAFEGRLTVPAIAAPMFLVSGPDLVVAACRAGVVGTIPALNQRTNEGYGAWLDEIETPAPYVTSTLFSKVMVALLTADVERARRYLTAQRAAHMQRMRELTAVKTRPGVSLGDVVAADYAIGHLHADLRWLQTTLTRVAELQKEVTS